MAIATEHQFQPAGVAMQGLKPGRHLQWSAILHEEYLEVIH